MARRGVITIKTEGNTNHLDGFFKRTKQRNFVKFLEYYAQRGVEALMLETPIDTGETAMSWGYEIIQEDGRITLNFTNSSRAGDTNIPVVILIQYGHATRNGGYVAPYDFINPITREIFNEIANTIWMEVTRK
jgi:hypothetical protein